MMSRLSTLSLFCALGVIVSCTNTHVVPDPKAAALAYAEAAERGDVQALYQLLNDRSRSQMTQADVERMVRLARDELREQGSAVRGASDTMVGSARVRFEDGAESTLRLKDGRFFVSSAGFTPGGGTRPEEALAVLRDTLKLRSYPALLRILSPSLRASIEAQLRGLIEGLENPAALAVPQGTDTVKVTLPNGHFVRLRREQGVWFVENFE